MKQIFVTLIALSLLLGCSAEHTDLASTGTGGFTKNPSPDPAIVASAKAAIETACANCHNTSNGTNTRFLPGSTTNTDMNALTDEAAYVQLGVPTGSALFTYFSTMPPGGALGTDSAEAQAVSAWIEEIGVFTGGSGVTFSQVWTTTLAPKCLDCHSSTTEGGPSGGISFDDYDDLVSSIVTPGNSVTSLIVDSIANRMPKETKTSTGKVTDTNHPYYVSDDELDDIIDWIDDGAPNN